MEQRLKILISAYACRPGEGSEPSIGWETVRYVAKEHNVWLLTRANNRPALNAELQRHPIPALHVIDIDLPAWVRWWNYKQRAVQIHYYIWQILAYFVGKRLHQEVGFDLIHHVTYVKYWSPSFLALLPVPFIWGPVGGGEECPTAFRATFSWRGRLSEMARDLARWVAEHDPFVKMTARRSAIVRATTQETADRLYKLGAKTVEVYSQVGIAPEQLAELTTYSSQPPTRIRFISIGRLLHWKGFHLGLEAFAWAKPQLPDDAEYWLVGDGIERQRLQTLAETLGIGERVHFKGKLCRQQTLKSLGECTALVHPSLHESGGMVCMEAMAVGIPVLCLNLGGPAVQVTRETGFKIPVNSPEQVLKQLAHYMIRLANNPDEQMQMGNAGKVLINKRYSWQAKGEDLFCLYQSVVSKYDSKLNTLLNNTPDSF